MPQISATHILKINTSVSVTVLLYYSQFIDVSVLDGGWSERPEQMARAKRYRCFLRLCSILIATDAAVVFVISFCRRFVHPCIV